MSKRDRKNNKDGRPSMLRRDLEREVAEAGRQAVIDNQGKPADPKIIAALARDGRPQRILGVDVNRPSLNSLIAWEQWLATEAAKTATPVTMMATTAYAYLMPDEAIDAMGEGDDVMLVQAREFARKLDTDSLKAITLLIRDHIAELFGTGTSAPADDGAKKKPRKP